MQMMMWHPGSSADVCILAALMALTLGCTAHASKKSFSLKAVLRGINSGLWKAGTFVEGDKGVVWCGMLWSLVLLLMEWWQPVAHVERTHSDFKCNGVVSTPSRACVIWEHFGVVACM